MKRIAVLTILLCTATAVTRAAQRIYTTPKPDAELKQLFPSTAAFSPLEKQPLHFKTYAADPHTNPTAKPIGFAFWTTDLMPQEHGYHKPIHILVDLDLTTTLTGIMITYDSEPYGYFSIEPPKFTAQFKNKTIRDPFIIERDVDAISHASITIDSTTRAIRDSSQLITKQLIPDTMK